MTPYLWALALCLGLMVYIANHSESRAALDIQDDAPVVLELFTSQSCSSCPPADALLAELAEYSSVIALGCHVTYWNHLSWKDTLSLPDCTERQRNYSAQANRNSVFTPELIINGGASMVGSNRGEIARALQDKTKLAKITIEKAANGQLDIHLPVIAPTTAQLHLLAFQSRHQQAIPSGENAGKTVHYVNAVTQIIPLKMRWDGSARTVHVDSTTITGNANGIAVLAQQGNGAVIAAGKILF